MQPTSPWIVVLLVIVCAGTLATLVRARQWLVRATCGLLAVGLGMLLGMVAVNDHYGYYSSWSSLASDVSGSVPETTLPGAADVSAHDAPAGGALLHVALPGQLSKIHRDGLVYLPPQYFQPRYRRVFFPVVEVFHGAPGGPADWVLGLHLPEVERVLISHHQMGPVVVVMPRIAPRAHVEECLDARRIADETYLVADVRHDVEARFRVSRSSSQWAVGGYSSGGYCAANLALRDWTAFHAAFAMDGYFQATDGPAATVLHKRRAAELANSPLYEASRLRRPVSTMPRFWVSAGTGNKDDLAQATAFVAQLRRLEQVPFLVQPGAQHTFYAWSAALPSALEWAWRQVATPEVRRGSPVAAPPSLSPARERAAAQEYEDDP